MAVAEDQLPEDVSALQAMLLAEREARLAAESLAAQRQSRAQAEEERAERLERLLAELRRALYGRRSERLSPDQLELLFEDVETAIAAVEAEADQAPVRALVQGAATGEPGCAAQASGAHRRGHRAGEHGLRLRA